jgi:O-antigen/teichoic acid export membrane protein
LVAGFIGYYGVLDLGLSQAITRYLGRSLGSADQEECSRVFNTALRIYALIGVAVLVLTTVLAALAPLFCKSAEDAALFWKIILILGITTALQFPARVFRGVLEAHLRFDLTAGLDLLTLGLRTVLVIAILLLGYRLLGLAWVTCLAGIPPLFLSIYWTRKELPFLTFDSKYWQAATAKTLFSYSAFSFIAHLADLLRFRVDNVVVAAFIGLQAVTHYSIASRLSDYFKELILALLGVFPSVFSRQEGAKDYEGIRRTFFFASKLSLCISSFIGFGLLAWGKAFIARWMGPRYVDAYPVLVALVLSQFFAVAQTPSVALLFGTSKHKFFAVANFVEGVANLALSLVLVKRYGMLGVALGTMIPMGVNRLLIQPAYVCRASEFKYFDYVGRMGRTLAVVLVSLVLPIVITVRFARPDYTVLVCIGLSSGAMYALALWLFEFTPKETNTLRRAIWPRLAVKG